MKYSFLFNLIFILIASIPITAFENEEVELTRKQYNWLYIGVGKFTYYPTLRFSCEVGFSVLRDTKLITLREYGYLKFDKEFEPEEVHIEIDILYGYCQKSSDFTAAISTGIGYVITGYREEGCHTFGIPLTGHFFWTPNRLLGIGVCISTNFNYKKHHFDVTLCGQIGILR